MEANRTFRSAWEDPAFEAACDRIEAVGFAFHSEKPVSIHQAGELVPSDVRRKEQSHGRRYTNRKRIQSSFHPAPGSKSTGRPGPKQAEQDWCRMGDLRVAYPQVNVVEQADGVWLEVTTLPFGKLGPQAKFFVASESWQFGRFKAWGFWITSRDHWWIGPRHTNPPDGSVCAFPGDDRSWRGDGLRGLTDALAIWAGKHAFLSLFGWWPGPQRDLGSWYRRMEFKANEWCGCGRSSIYGECCQPRDLETPIEQAISEFFKLTSYGSLTRSPPDQILDFGLYQKGSLPAIEQLSWKTAL